MIRGSWASFRPQGAAGRPSTLLRLQRSPSSAPGVRRDALPSPLHLPPPQDFLALDVHKN